MLVLTRKRNEKIRIGENIVVEVIEFGPSQCRIGITAPPDVRILREEVWQLQRSKEDK